ncbi:MAG: NAD(P)H-nitrite reductase large subunit [Verrucomicrobiales bacterium]|jgi:NAD(P)H-nitrite reductase large subunit
MSFLASTIENSPTESEAKRDAIVCNCFKVSEGDIRDAVDFDDAETVEDVTRKTCAGGACTACHVRIERVLNGKSASCTAGRFDFSSCLG